MSKKTHLHVSQTLQTIITKCGQALYETYLMQKLPADCNQKVINNVQANFQSLNIQKPIKNKITRQFMPRPASVDIITPSKIVVKSKIQPQQRRSNSNKNILFATEIIPQKQTTSYRSILQSSKPNFCIKYSCQKGDIDKNQQRIRKQKIETQKFQLKIANLNTQQQQKKQYKKKNLQSKIKQLLIQGIPYSYDNQGNLDMPDIKSYKKQIQNQNKSKIKKKLPQQPFSLKFKALEYLTQGSQLQSNSKISGRKKGFSNVKTQRKKKINDEDFSNKHQRQFSAIPFMNVQDGVKIVQRQRNIMAQKSHRPHTSRQQYIKTSQKSLFKSFLPLSQYNSERASSAGRPTTHSFSRGGRNTPSVGLVSVSSFSIRPQTSKDRVNINNKELAVQMVKEDHLLARKLII